MVKKSSKKLPDIVRSVVIEADINKVWDAIATKEGLEAWLMPNNFKPILGYEFTFKSQPKGDWDGICHCIVKELNPPYKLGFTWSGNNLDQYVSFELKEIDDKTEFTLVHSGWSEENMQLREIMYDGWGYLSEGLKRKMGDNNGKYLS
nr:SRPBCC domain-containing protein [Clostridium sp. YIM B02551]